MFFFFSVFQPRELAVQTHECCFGILLYYMIHFKTTTFKNRRHFKKNKRTKKTVYLVFGFCCSKFNLSNETKTQSQFSHLLKGKKKKPFIVNSLPALREVGVVYFTVRDLLMRRENTLISSHTLTCRSRGGNSIPYTVCVSS